MIFADYLLLRLAPDFEFLSVLQPIKNWLFVTGSGLLLFALVSRMHADLKKQERLLTIAGSYAKLGGWIVYLPKYDLEWSAETAAIHGMPPDYSPSVEDALNYYAPEYRETIGKVFAKCVEEGIPYDEELEIITASGQRKWVRTIGEAVFNRKGDIVAVQGSFQNISDRKEIEQDLFDMAMRDQLTGLPRPHVFYEHLEHAVSLAKRKKLRLAVAYIDLDNLKQINDNFGHDVGDAYLKIFSLKLRECSRDSDIVARLGGDEFGAFLENLTDQDQINEIFDRLEQCMGESIEINGQKHRIDFSIGWSLYPDHADNPQSLITKADQAMYANKNSKKKDRSANP